MRAPRHNARTPQQKQPWVEECDGVCLVRVQVRKRMRQRRQRVFKSVRDIHPLTSFGKDNGECAVHPYARREAHRKLRQEQQMKAKADKRKANIRNRGKPKAQAAAAAEQRRPGFEGRKTNFLNDPANETKAKGGKKKSRPNFSQRIRGKKRK